MEGCRRKGLNLGLPSLMLNDRAARGFIDLPPKSRNRRREMSSSIGILNLSASGAAQQPVVWPAYDSSRS